MCMRLKFESAFSTRASPARNAFVSSTINTFVFYLEVGKLPETKRNLGKKFLQNFISNRGGPEKSTETRHEMKERKETALHLLCVFGRCRGVFLRSFISCLVSVLLQVHTYLK